MDSKIGLVIQFTGIFLVTVLSLFLRRSLKSVISGYWLTAWASLSLALFCLSWAFSHGEMARPLFFLYFFGEYVFGLMLIAGCRNLAGRSGLSLRYKLVFLPFLVVALILAFLAEDFNLVFNFHALILAVFFAVGFATLRHSPIKTFGWRVMRVALALLALSFFHYFILFSCLGLGFNLPLPEGYLSFNPVIDLVLEVLLGFGMVIVLLEKVLGEVQDANEKLRQAHNSLEQIAQIDPLTEAFNRHAFYGFLKKRDDQTISGCVGFFDIDNLKPINDRYGHAAGDMAIRAVVRAIREIVRAEDLIFRWGGDEFFVIMVSMSAEMSRQRMSRLEAKLTDIGLPGLDQPLTIGVSYGFTDFADLSELEQAVRTADEEMYQRKHERKCKALLAGTTHFAQQPELGGNQPISAQ